MKLNLFCGSVHRGGEDWVNIDMVAPADVILRVGRDQLPYGDSSIDRIEIDNGLEHLNNDEFMFAMNECWRVLKPQGVFWFKVPDAKRWFDGAAGDPTHKRFFTDRSFLYFQKGHNTYENYGKAYGFKPWNKIKLEPANGFFTYEGNPYK